MSKRILNLLLAVVLFVPVSISAAPVDATQNRGPIHVTSDRLEADDEAQIVIFSGNAVATQDDVTIHADRLTIHYTGEQREIVQVVADGHVRILQQEKVDEAVRMFRINADLYPESWNVYDSLGEALLAAGKTSDAITMYKKSIALNPQNEHGKEVLEGIRSSASL